MAQCAASACSVEHHLMAAGPRSGLGAPGRGLAVQARGFGKLVTVHGIFRYLLEPTGSPPPPLLNALSCLAVNSPTAHKLSFALLPVASASPPTNCCLNFLCPQTTSRLPNSLAPTPLPSSSSSQPFHPISSRRHNEPYQGAPPGPPAHDPLPRQAHRPLQYVPASQPTSPLLPLPLPQPCPF